MLEYLKDRCVSIAVWDRESPNYDMIGGGISEGNPKNVAILLGVDEHWVEFQWKHSGQIVAVPACDVVCIASDLPRKGQEEAEVIPLPVNNNPLMSELERRHWVDG